MMNALFILLQSSGITEGGKRMAESDPHGWTLTLISVSVVFIALVILFLAFSLVGRISKRADARKESQKAEKPQVRKNRPADEGVAAVIALALEAEKGGEVPIAIATALALYLGKGVHDSEPYVITIRRAPSAWDSPAFRFRKNPVK